MTADQIVTINRHASYVAGYNVCIFAYGQTGSGKTHTMAGSDVEDYAGRGINYRALDDLFAINEERQGEVRHPLLITSILMAGHWKEEMSLCCWTSARQSYQLQLAMSDILPRLLTDIGMPDASREQVPSCFVLTIGGCSTVTLQSDETFLA